ncbi:MAG: hypothetical protein AAGF79_13310 [Pseudomonadota bacterium]
MARAKEFSVVKTAQTAHIQKIVVDGIVVASITVTGSETAELRDHREHLIGTYADAATAISEFERHVNVEVIELDL